MDVVRAAEPKWWAIGLAELPKNTDIDKNVPSLAAHDDRLHNTHWCMCNICKFVRYILD